MKCSRCQHETSSALKFRGAWERVWPQHVECAELIRLKVDVVVINNAPGVGRARVSIPGTGRLHVISAQSSNHSFTFMDHLEGDVL